MDIIATRGDRTLEFVGDGNEDNVRKVEKKLMLGLRVKVLCLVLKNCLVNIRLRRMNFLLLKRMEMMLRWRMTWLYLIKLKGSRRLEIRLDTEQDPDINWRGCYEKKGVDGGVEEIIDDGEVTTAVEVADDMIPATEETRVPDEGGGKVNNVKVAEETVGDVKFVNPDKKPVDDMKEDKPESIAPHVSRLYKKRKLFIKSQRGKLVKSRNLRLSGGVITLLLKVMFLMRLKNSKSERTRYC